MKRFIIGAILAILGIASVYAIAVPNIVGFPSTSVIDTSSTYLMVQDGTTQNSILVDDFVTNLNISGGTSSGITEELDPVFLAQSGNYYTANPLGYITGYDETDPIWMADSGYYIPWNNVSTGIEGGISDTLIMSQGATSGYVNGFFSGLTNTYLPYWNGGLLNSKITLASNITTIHSPLVVSGGNITFQSGYAIYKDSTKVLDFTEGGNPALFENTYIGSLAGYLYVGGIEETIIGGYAGVDATNNRATLIGYGAGSNSSGERLTAIGNQAAIYNHGYGSTSIGYFALAGNPGGTSGDYNVGIGYTAGFNLRGLGNVAVGFEAQYSSISSKQVSIGYQAGGRGRGLNNIYIGEKAGHYTSGYNVTAIGYESASYTGNATFQYVSNNSILLGYQAGTGYSNISNILSIRQANINLNPLIRGDFLSGFVSIGKDFPTQALDVSGAVRITTTTDSCSAGVAGTMKYSGTNFYGCNGTDWKQLDN